MQLRSFANVECSGVRGRVYGLHDCDVRIFKAPSPVVALGTAAFAPPFPFLGLVSNGFRFQHLVSKGFRHLAIHL